MFSLSFIEGSKSAEGAKKPQANLDRAVQFEGGPNPLGHRHFFRLRFRRASVVLPSPFSWFTPERKDSSLSASGSVASVKDSLRIYFLNSFTIVNTVRHKMERVNNNNYYMAD